VADPGRDTSCSRLVRGALDLSTAEQRAPRAPGREFCSRSSN